MFVFTEPISNGRFGISALAQYRTGSLHFDRITQRGPRPVRLQIVDLPRAHTRTAQSLER